MSQFSEICQKLQAIDCTVARYSNPGDIEAGERRDYSNIHPKLQNQFDYIHLLVAAINGEKTPFSRHELSHMVSDGKLSF